MLDKKTTEATIKVLAKLDLPETTYTFVTTQPIILKYLEAAYLQGRKDQIDNVYFTELPSGRLCFTDVAR